MMFDLMSYEVPDPSRQRKKAIRSLFSWRNARKDAEDFRDEPARTWKSRTNTAQPMQK